MLSYRHAFHAGNFADVLKHVVLIALVDALGRKPSPWCCLDTHAGAGRYDLNGTMALRNREYDAGLQRLWWRDDLPAPVARWRELVTAANVDLDEDAPPRWYPGSPLLLASLLRETDRLQLCELHPSELSALRRLFAHRRHVGVHARDGYEALVALLPPVERRSLVLIDPSYETGDEIARMTSALGRALHRSPGSVYAIWYPLLARKSMQPLLDWASGIGRRVLNLELRLRAELPPMGMHACGMLVINTPWRLDEELAPTLSYLAEVLGEDAGARGVIDWMVPDAGQVG